MSMIDFNDVNSCWGMWVPGEPRYVEEGAGGTRGSFLGYPAGADFVVCTSRGRGRRPLFPMLSPGNIEMSID